MPENELDGARRAFLARKWSKKLAARAKADHSFPEGGDPLDVLAKADPSPRKEYLDWICRVYCSVKRSEAHLPEGGQSEGFLAEDVERVSNTLVLFHRWKHRLPVAERDIGRHRSEQSVWSSVERFDPSRNEDIEPEGRELRRHERAKALAESEVCEDEGLDGWIVASPKTEFASGWWGRGTRWCTAMQSGTHFRHYSKSGPLRVFVSPDGAKFQAHVATGSCGDSQDRRVDFAAFVSRLPEPAAAVLRADVRRLMPASDGPVKMSYDTHMILSLPISLVPEDVAAALRAKGMEKIQILAEESGWKLYYVREAISKWALGLRTANDYPFGQSDYLILDSEAGDRMVAETNDKSVKPLRELLAALVKAPEAFAKEGVAGVCGLWEAKSGFKGQAWMAAVVETVGADRISPDSWQGLARKVAKLSRNWHDFAIPREVIDDAVADILATGWSLTAIPEGMMTKPRLMAILSRHPELIQTEVPSLGLANMVDREVAMAMVSYRNGEGLQYVPRDFLTRHFIVAALERHPRAVKHVPEGTLTREMCLSVVAMDGNMAKEIPRHFLDRELCLQAVRQNGTILNFVPVAMRDGEICSAALSKNPDQFPHATCDLRYEDYLAGVAVSGSLLARVPLQYRDERMCLAACRKQFDASYHVPPLVGERLKAEYPEEFVHYRGKLSSRYGATHAIREFQPDDMVPAALPPVPGL